MASDISPAYSASLCIYKPDDDLQVTRAQIVRDSCKFTSLIDQDADAQQTKVRQRMTSLLDDYYDRQHRAYHIEDLGKVLEPLKIRYHGRMRDMSYDERYTEHIEPTDFLPFISLVSRGPPDMNVAAITAVVDRWRNIFADSGGKLAHWCWLKALTVLGHKWSWGTTTLAYLYRQLDDAFRGTGTMGIGGYALTVLKHNWSWGTASLAYLYRQLSCTYKQYTEELDTLTAEQVDWEPYGSRYHFGTAMRDLNPKCLEERYEIKKHAEECEIVWDNSLKDENASSPLRNFVKIWSPTFAKLWHIGNLLGCRDGEIATPSPSPPEDEPHDLEIPDDTVLSQAKEQAHAARSAYMLKPRGKGPNHYTPEDYVNRGKKVVLDSD
ncbi:uncharacterized protein [Lolium perenne]|uniref:uncharacterized protein n=1 Tax=Lolium perenne TaxID=4522 RepID=UPI0021F55FA7|nr:uncharacterized protein LOC127340233 [Lolium perenne]